LYSPKSSSGGKAADIFCRNKREEKRTGSGRRERRGERERDEEQKVEQDSRRRENKRAIGNRTESFSLACLACYDGISEMVELWREKEKERNRD